MHSALPRSLLTAHLAPKRAVEDQIDSASKFLWGGHAMDEVRNAPAQSPTEKKTNGAVKQLPMFGRNNVAAGDSFNFANSEPDSEKPTMHSAVSQLDKYFNMSPVNNRQFSSSNDSSRSGSFCSDAESLPSSSPPRESFCNSPVDASNNLRLPIFSRFA